MGKNRKRAYLALLISTGFLTGTLAGCGSARKAEAEDAAHAPTAPVVKVARRSLSNTLEIASEFQPLQEIEVYAKVSGYIKKLYVDWGTHVKKGQLLAELEIPELQQQLQQDEAGARRSDQDLSRAREELNRAQSAYNVAHLTYGRLAEVQKSRPELMAQEEIDAAQGKDLEASAGVSSARDAVAAAEPCSDMRASQPLSTEWLRKFMHTPERCCRRELLRTRATWLCASFRKTILCDW
jgi:multidrug efflux pump subunit AcrA (membrane-fusion protein)